MPKETANEVIVINFNARKLAELGGIILNRLLQQTGAMDFKKLDLGFVVPENYLTIGGAQPTMAELTVLAQKLKLQICITGAELKTSEELSVEAKTAAAGK